MKVRKEFIFVILSLLFLSFSPEAYDRVTYVYDGDTIRLESGERVRYLGVDSPEIGRDGAESEFLAEEAKAFNKKLVMGARIRLEYGKERKDRYGRTLAFIFLDTGEMVNALLVRNGLAYVLSKKPNLEYRDRLLEAQRAAMAERVGIWSRTVEPEETHYVGNRASFIFHRPGCTFGSKTSLRNRVEFKTRLDAFREGYSPCRRCRP